MFTLFPATTPIKSLPVQPLQLYNNPYLYNGVCSGDAVTYQTVQ